MTVQSETRFGNIPRRPRKEKERETRTKGLKSPSHDHSRPLFLIYVKITL